MAADGSQPPAAGARVGVDGEQALRLSHPAVERPFTVVQLCDLQLWMPGRTLTAVERDGLRRSGRAESLGGTDDDVLRLVDELAARAPDLVLVPGDLVDCYEPGALGFAAAVLARLPAPVHVTLGNHDICRYEPPNQWTNSLGAAAAAIRQAWRERLGSPRFTYAFRHDGVRFIALDTSESRLLAGDVDWLAAELEADGGTPTVLFYHVPAPIPSLLPEVARHRGTYYCLAQDEETRRFLDLVARSPCVLAALCGHVHFASAHTWGAMVQTTIRPSCVGGYRLLSVTP